MRSIKNTCADYRYLRETLRVSSAVRQLCGHGNEQSYSSSFFFATKLHQIPARSNDSVYYVVSVKDRRRIHSVLSSRVAQQLSRFLLEKHNFEMSSHFPVLRRPPRLFNIDYWASSTQKESSWPHRSNRACDDRDSQYLDISTGEMRSRIHAVAACGLAPALGRHQHISARSGLPRRSNHISLLCGSRWCAECR